ncbi:uncharacterized protein A1O5_04855 [Cladophialophora psammophila CBS 110553]|uniref:Fe2OG dioxygenase domain-containing protein n=1 Tax=Cladophialophora psammophila CBS 110553 TaxID=1182543 RepID=W9X633_9EURO|nr:uncharacterized protein A1O5_04855 [Cladophialophora psammophila CBS 110553]EXJ72351.1 hypothetical protein A1O5_04855 [Cladophialophora psammophila CBS 110553]
MSDEPDRVAKLGVVDLAALRSHESTELEKLLNAARSTGFFYLNLQHDLIGGQISAMLPGIYRISEDFFHQPSEEKMKFYRASQNPSQDRGYKRSTCDETLEMAYDEVLQQTCPLPPVMQEEIELVDRFSKLCHSTCLTVLSSFSDALGLLGDQRFESKHREGEASDSGLKLISEPTLDKLSQVGDNLHTDSGTLTMLFYNQWGLEVEQPDGPAWAFTAPVPEYALFNVADSLQRLSGLKFHSPKHRVTQTGDGAGERYYISYFLRPEHALRDMWIQ